MNDILFNNEWYSYSAAVAGALWGVSLQPDFGRISLKTKAWRCLLAILLAFFIGPGLLHTYFKDASMQASTAVMFGLSMAALTVVPIVLRRVQLLAKTGKLWGLPEDSQ